VRKAVNENPVVQIALIGVLAVVVGFLFLTRMHGNPPPATTTPSAPAAGAAPATAPVAPDASASAPDAASPATGTDSTTPPASTGSDSSGFVAGPGLPAPVVKAYADNKVVVLLVTRQAGIDDRAVRASVQRLRARGDVVVFTTPARHVARYSRIAEGVNLDRVPAMVVITPRDLTPRGDLPQASVRYGFRGDDSVLQAIRDALYKGPRDLSFFPH
jgi:hypothetical protein